MQPQPRDSHLAELVAESSSRLSKWNKVHERSCSLMPRMCSIKDLQKHMTLHRKQTNINRSSSFTYTRFTCCHFFIDTSKSFAVYITLDLKTCFIAHRSLVNMNCLKSTSCFPLTNQESNLGT